MFRKLNDFFANLSAHVSLVILIVGSSAFAVAWGWAASTAQWLAAYGPIAWVAAATFGAGFFILLALGYAKARAKLVRASIERQFFQRPDSINPLELEYKRQRINIVDLASPIEPVIRGKSFVECELIGPATIVIFSTTPGGGSLSNCSLSEVFAVLVKEGAPAANAIIFEDCTIFRCTLHKVTFLFPETLYEWANSVLPGLPWLTPEPPRP